MVTIIDEPWFVMKDAMEPLGLTGYPSRYTARLAKQEVLQVTRHSHVLNATVANELITSRGPSIALISESGLYKVILSSRKKEAQQFKNWVTQDVLPAIRKDGMYVQGEEKVATGEMSEDQDVIHVLKSKVGQTHVSFPNRGMRFISAPALYSAVLRSDKKEAAEFQDWVARTVLPAIRNDGMYVLGEEKVTTGEMTEDQDVIVIYVVLMDEFANIHMR